MTLTKSQLEEALEIANRYLSDEFRIGVSDHAIKVCTALLALNEEIENAVPVYIANDKEEHSSMLSWSKHGPFAEATHAGKLIRIEPIEEEK
jgi:hypothetical protein